MEDKEILQLVFIIKQVQTMKVYGKSNNNQGGQITHDQIAATSIKHISNTTEKVVFNPYKPSFVLNSPQYYTLNCV